MRKARPARTHATFSPRLSARRGITALLLVSLILVLSVPPVLAASVTRSVLTRARSDFGFFATRVLSQIGDSLPAAPANGPLGLFLEQFALSIKGTGTGPQDNRGVRPRRPETRA